MLLPPRVASWLKFGLVLSAILVIASAAPVDPKPGQSTPSAATPALSAPDTPAARPAQPGEEKYWQALKYFRSTKPADLAAGRAALQAAADVGHTHAQKQLGDALIGGWYGFAKSEKKGARLIQQAAAHGNAFAKVSLGQCFGSGTGLRKDLTKSADCFTAALAPDADYSHPTPPADFFQDTPDTLAGELASDPVAEAQATAHYFLGLICDEKKQLPEAHAHFVAAAQAGPGGHDGVVAAAVRSALDCAFGRGTPRDLPQASAFLDQSRKLAERMRVRQIHNFTTMKIVDEFATADLEESTNKAGTAVETMMQMEIAALFANKQAKEYNPAEAVKWYELAAESGNEWAMLSLGLLYAQGAMGQPDFNQAFTWFEKVGTGDQPKLFLGAANLALCYLRGWGTKPDDAKAMEIFKKFRDHDIVCYLGSIGQAPASAVSFAEALQLNLDWAKNKNDAHAQYLLGKRYVDGYGVKAKRKDAIPWLKKAAEANHGGALCELGSLYYEHGVALGLGSIQEVNTAAADCYRRSAKLGNVDAMANLARLLYLGWGTSQDQEGAEALDRQALQIDPRHARTFFNLAGIYSDRLNQSLARKDIVNADKWRVLMVQHYEKALELEYHSAAQVLGDLFYDGVQVEQDYKRAYGYYQKAADWGINLVHYQLGQMHELGRGVPVTYAEAAYHYRLAALSGSMNATKCLAELYAAGKGVPRDLERAIYWATTMIQFGDLHWVSRVADLYIQNKNYDLAFRIFSNLSETESPELRGIANHRLYVLYSYGWGVTKNVKKAQRFLKKSLKDGNLTARHDSAMALISEGQKSKGISLLEKLVIEGQPNSKYELGRIYLKGEDMPKNVIRGMTLLKEAADVGIEEAEVTLANLALEDSPGAPDLDTAIRLASAAAASGSASGAEILEKLEKRREKCN